MTFFLNLIVRNLGRHRLRTALTLAGIVVAICSFALLRTVVDAWYAGADASSAARLITRNAISLTFNLPMTYRPRIEQLRGVRQVSWLNWFGGVYVNEKNFFPQFAIDPPTYLALYPEYLMSEAEHEAFRRDRRGAIAGRKLAERYGWQVGDQIPIRGTIYPGDWSFNLRGIYRGGRGQTDEGQFFFQHAFLNETLRARGSPQAETVGVFVIGLDDPGAAAEVSLAVDAAFRNSLAETLTETERAFQLSFVAMSEALVLVIQVVSLLIIVIIMAVMANTMAMSVRERRAEYATLKALGFGPRHVVLLIFGESLALAITAGVLGIAVSFPLAAWFASSLGTFFPVFVVSRETVLLAFLAAIVVGVVAALAPTLQVIRLPVTAGLRSVG